jgi:hypothetical protein
MFSKGMSASLRGRGRAILSTPIVRGNEVPADRFAGRDRMRRNATHDAGRAADRHFFALASNAGPCGRALRLQIGRSGSGALKTAREMPIRFAGPLSEIAMNARLKELRDLVVALDRADRKIQRLDADAYQAAARQALRLTGEEMGLLPIGDFAGPVNALQNMAENIFFAGNGCFADLDGTGRAPVARTAARALLKRLRKATDPSARDITDKLLVRLRA